MADIIITDEKGKELTESLGFPDTIVNQYSERVLTLTNTTKYKIWVKPIIDDKTIELIKYPKFLKPNEKGIAVFRYTPTMEHLRPLDSIIGFEFKVV